MHIHTYIQTNTTNNQTSYTQYFLSDARNIQSFQYTLFSRTNSWSFLSIQIVSWCHAMVRRPVRKPAALVQMGDADSRGARVLPCECYFYRRLVSVGVGVWPSNIPKQT